MIDYIICELRLDLCVGVVFLLIFICYYLVGGGRSWGGSCVEVYVDVWD